MDSPSKSWIVYWIIIHSLLIVVLAWKGYYVATSGQMVLLGYSANEYLMWQSFWRKEKSKTPW